MKDDQIDELEVYGHSILDNWPLQLFYFDKYISFFNVRRSLWIIISMILFKTSI